ncbi:MAG: polysaccharide biosynthesis C-terminal domain-containing protein, partial [Oscillospiraceae bacterium]|nr:polysaccharide biosynthesis C-terminal domain-containing protein [Oscillospiraceae bacterium]
SEEVGLGRPGSIDAVLHRALGYAAFFGFAAALTLWLAAEPIGFLWVRDARTVRSLALYALSLPAVSLSSVFCGYFTAVGRVWKTAAEQFLEQLLRIALTALLLGRVPAGDLERCCSAVVLAGVLADFAGLAALWLLCLMDRRRHRSAAVPCRGLTPRLLHIALPLAVAAYARSALNTFRQLLVPRCLKRFGLSADAALTGYGVIGGMAMPLLIFPTAVLSALAELLVPELTAIQMAGDRQELRQRVKKMLGRTLLFSLFFAVFFFVSADLLGWLVYRDRAAAVYLRLLAPLIPFLYTDIVTDGCLKGLGQMLPSMAFNIAEAALGLVLVWLLVPRWGLAGYLTVLYVCEIFNFALSLHRLRQVLAQEPKAAVSSPQSSSSRNRISYEVPSSLRSRHSSPAKASSLAPGSVQRGG